MLTDAEIKAAGLIRGGLERNYRSASYDLQIGELIQPDGTVVSSYTLPPQGIVEVISTEEVRMPHEIAGIAMVKTKLCQEGMLALSIGIIDPGFEGRISSFLINFGKNDRLLQRGDIFLRTTYQRLATKPENVQAKRQDQSEMIRERRRASVEKFEATFLSVDRLAAKSAEAVFNKYKAQVLTYVGLAALVLATLTFLINFGTIWLKWPDLPRSDLKELTKQNEDLKSRLIQLEQRLPFLPNSTTRTEEKR